MKTLREEVADSITGSGYNAEHYPEALQRADEIIGLLREKSQSVKRKTNDEESELMPLLAGDYVLATKYSDGDPQDHWCVGFFHSMLPKTGGDRFQVVDNEGNQFRGNGFRRAQKIGTNEGRWLLEHASEIEASERSVWDWLDSLSNS